MTATEVLMSASIEVMIVTVPALFVHLGQLNVPGTKVPSLP